MDTNLTPLISVLLPVYNAENYIEASIQSIINQSYVNWELLVYNDASNDNTLNVLNNIKDDRIKIINSKTNRGIVNALNELISIAKGEYIARMDADDISLNKRFELQLNYLLNNSNVSVVGSWAMIIDKDGIETGEVWRVQENVGHEYLFFNNYIVHGSVLIRAIVLKKYKYCIDYLHAEDYYLWSELSYISEIRNIQAALVKYRVHDNSISRLNTSIQKNTVKNIYRFHLQKFGAKYIDEFLNLHYDIFNNEFDLNKRSYDSDLVLEWFNYIWRIVNKSPYKKDYHFEQFSIYFNKNFDFRHLSNKGLKSLKYCTSPYFRKLEFSFKLKFIFKTFFYQFISIKSIS